MYEYIYTYVVVNFFISSNFCFSLFFSGGGGGSMITSANEIAASSTGFPRLSWTARAGDKRNRGMMRMSVKREQGVMGTKRRGFFSPSHSSLLSLIINSNIPQKVIASDWGRGR